MVTVVTETSSLEAPLFCEYLRAKEGTYRTSEREERQENIARTLRLHLNLTVQKHWDIYCAFLYIYVRFRCLLFFVCLFSFLLPVIWAMARMQVGFVHSGPSSAPTPGAEHVAYAFQNNDPKTNLLWAGPWPHNIYVRLVHFGRCF